MTISFLLLTFLIMLSDYIDIDTFLYLKGCCVKDEIHLAYVCYVKIPEIKHNNVGQLRV